MTRDSKAKLLKFSTQHAFRITQSQNQQFHQISYLYTNKWH